MALSPNGAFEGFDPMEGGVPSYHTEAFDYVLFMARKYLQGKTSKDVVSIYQKVNEVIAETNSGAIALDKLGEMIETQEKGMKHTVKPFTNSQHLLESWNKYRKEKKILKGVKWSEMFAAQALVFSGFSVTDEKEMNPNDEELKDWDLYNISYQVAMWGFDAMESIGYATMCYAIESNESSYNDVIDDLLSQRVKERNQKAVEARHGKINALKEEFRNYYFNGDFQSRAEAARRFYKNLPEDKQSLLVPTNAVRTLTQSLPKNNSTSTM